MKLILVTLHNNNPISLNCIACGKRCNQAHEAIHADIEGVAFQDYYCEACKADIEANMDLYRAKLQESLTEQEWFSLTMAD